MKKVCLVTPGHISSNPRLVKEAIALENAGFCVHIVFTQYEPHLIKEDFHILENHYSWRFDRLDWTNKTIKSKFKRTYSGLLNWLVNFIYTRTNFQFLLPYLLNRNFVWQKTLALKAKADLYIGHNLSVLPVVSIVGKKLKVKVGFDAEDFHRFETTDDKNSFHFKSCKKIEDEYIPKLDYLSAASPLIAKEYEILYGIHVLTINNFFPKSFVQDKFKKRDTSRLKLFWFSQTIGKNRGLEDVIEAMNQISEFEIELHLLGKISSENRNFLLGFSHYQNRIFFYETISPDLLFDFSRQFDIGLALERKTPYNRNICLTNKIFTYLLGGLAVIASDTDAQIDFMSNYPSFGLVYPIGDIIALSNLLKKMYSQNILESLQKGAISLAQNNCNWETEQSKYILKVKELLV